MGAAERPRQRARPRGLLLAVALSAAGCTWVPLTPEGERVRVLSAEATAACDRIGQVRGRTSTRVGIFARRESKVLEEQTSLARNEAARMGGDAITRLAGEEDGERVFDVYRCSRPGVRLPSRVRPT